MEGLTFLSTIILARLLLPEEFGIVGYCLIAIQYLDILNSAGIDTSLIAQRDNLEEAANAAFRGKYFARYRFFWLDLGASPFNRGFFPGRRNCSCSSCVKFVFASQRTRDGSGYSSSASSALQDKNGA